jgi:mRNA interferase HigB
VRIISVRTLRDYVQRMAGGKDQYSVDQALRAWVRIVRHSSWKSSADVKLCFAGASVVGSDRVVFNIKGNHYRLVAGIHCERETVYIKCFGTHAQYGKIDVRTVDFDD